MKAASVCVFDPVDYFERSDPANLVVLHFEVYRMGDNTPLGARTASPCSSCYRVRVVTAVKIGEGAKTRLEELHAEIRLRTCQKVTQQELLTRLIKDAYESPDEVIDSFRESTVPLSEEQQQAMQQGRVSSGVTTDEDDGDDVLYG